jgi:exopolysaccharide biosynthesis protein
MTTSELGQILLDLGVVNAANLDGGGSTTLVVKDCWIGDVVNHPSDNGSSDHHGARPVGSGLYIR